MLDLIGSLFSALFSLLGGLLPDSPFAAYIQAIDGAQLGLGWLNWLVPVHDFTVILFLWIAAAAIVSAVKFAVQETFAVGTSLV